MRKTLCIILSLLMIVAPLTFGVSAVSGTAINSSADFLAMDPAGTYYLAKDITLTGRYGYADPDNPVPFTGTLDGNGHTITVSDCIFETLNGATIKNLTIAGEVVIANGGTTGSGVLARNSKENGATLENITNNAPLTIEVIEGNAYVGTLIGAVSKGTLTVTNCTNNGNITASTAFNYNGKTDVAPRFGGLTGNVAKDVVPTFTDCVNNGDIELFDTSVNADGDPIVSTGASYLGGITSDCFTGTFIRCTNNGNLSSNVPLDGAGICGRTPPSKQLADHSVTYEYCVNNGDVTTSAKSSRAIGGIQGYAGASGVTAVYKIWHCVNTGDISYTGAATGNMGGIAGYVYASGSTEYVDVAYNINLGNVSCENGTAFVSEFVGYSNSNGNKVYNNIGLGKLTAGFRSTANGDVYLNVFLGCSSADVNGELCQGNVIIDTAGVNFYSFATAAENASRCIAIADAPEGVVTFVTAAQVKSGEAAYIANQLAGSNMFFQNIDKGTKDNAPTVDDKHGIVYNNDGTFSNTLKCKHAKKVLVNTTATCVTGGIDTHYECPDCGLWLKADGTTVVAAEDCNVGALGHKVGKANAKGQYTCERCGLFVKGKVYNESDFLAMAPYGGEFELANDITLTASYTNIVDGTEMGFWGTFDGKDHVIKGSVTAFKRVGEATIKNVVLGSKTAPETILGAEDATDIIGALIGTVEPSVNLVVENVTNYKNVARADAAGGIIGEFSNSGTATLKNLVNYGAIQGDDQVGGIVGWLKGAQVTVDNCKNYGAIKSSGYDVEGVTGGNYAGGILGRWGDGKTTVNGVATLATITNCVNEGTVDSTKSQTAGIVGYVNQSIAIDKCVNKADILDEPGHVGGIVGSFGYLIGSTTTITNCENYGKLTGKGHSGGIIGQGQAEMTIIDGCVNKGDVVATGNEAGGIAGTLGYSTTDSDGKDVGSLASFKILNSTNYGNVLSNANHVGGILGGSNGQKQKVTYWVEKCGNYGNVTLDTANNKNEYCGGVVGYMYGGSAANGIVDCFNMGTVSAVCSNETTGTSSFLYAGGIVAYFNTVNLYAHGNFNAGAVSATDSRTQSSPKISVAQLIYNNNAAGDGAEYMYNNWNIATSEPIVVNAGTPVEDYALTFTAADLTNGKLVKSLNDGEGATVYYQGATNPVLDAAILYGDANGDGFVDMKDLALIRAYIANFDRSTGTSVVAVQPGADCDGDGTVIAKDLMYLRAYIANYDQNTKTSTVVLGPQ